MDSKRINLYYSELEKIATYNNEEISEKEFIEDLLELKKDLAIKNFEIPEIFNKVRTKYDFRSNMQTYGGYKERRDILKKYMYPIIEMYEQEILNKKIISSEKLSVKEINSYLRQSSMYLKTKYGNILINNFETQSGGNGTVYFGKLAETDVAIKFLINNSKSKLNRFLCEFANIILKLNENDGIVKLFFYDEIIIENKIYPLICMKMYKGRLEYNDNYTENDIIRIVKQMLYALQKIHNAGIVHRDLKPQNILIDENNDIHISDFGIAYYNPDFFEMTGHTVSSDRLANYDFSAPEQRDSKMEPLPSMDIYSVGQLIQWLVSGETCKGTHRHNLYEKYKTSRMYFLDGIVDKCLNNDPNKRFQNVEEIYNEIERYNIDKKESKLPSTIIESSVINATELKNALKDIMDKICIYEYGEYNENYEKTFTIYNKINDESVNKFLENIAINLKKFEFFDNVAFSKFIEGYTIYDNYSIDKKSFELLNQLYIDVERNKSELKLPFIEYIKSRINENIEELPF